MNATSKTIKSYYHSLKSKTCKNNTVLIILSYDYFLNKRDLRVLLNKYQRIFLLLKTNDLIIIDPLIINDIIIHYSNIEIIFNPLHEKKKDLIYTLLNNNTKKIHTNSVFEFCKNILKKCYISEDSKEITPILSDLRYFGIYPRIIKKTIDVIIGASLYILTQPLWVVSACKIYWESPGSIFYKQKRVGICNREFTIIKFRSMILDAEINGAQFSNKSDNRIFPWGKIMRATRIDELPQLFNILKGELSLIGPRPERKVFVEKFEEIIPHYNDRHVVKPGISGYAQIMYPYGAGINDARQKLMYDLFYIKYWSLKLELKILLKTIWIVLSKHGV